MVFIRQNAEELLINNIDYSNQLCHQIVTLTGQNYGLCPSPIHATYSASKAALYNLTLALRIEIARHQYPISVFGVYPGPIDTDLAEGLNVSKASSSEVAIRVFDGMKKGVLDITTDALSDNFESLLRKNLKVIAALKQTFAR